MNEAQVVALTAELRTSNTPSLQEPLPVAGTWKVTAQAAAQTAAATVLDIATRHGITAETNRAEFRGTAAQARAVAENLQASKISVVLDYVGDGTTDVWVARAVSGLFYTIQEVINLGTTHGVAASTNRAVFK